MQSNCKHHLVFDAIREEFVENKSRSGWLRLLDNLDRPYMLVNVPKSVEMGLTVLHRGIEWGGEFWIPADAIVRDDEGATFVCFMRTDKAAPRDPDTLAMRLNRKWVVRNENDIYKRQKYAKREFAPHMASIDGRIIELIGVDGFRVATDDGYELTVRIPKVPKDVEPYVDGLFFVSQLAVELVLGKTVPFGSGIRATIDTPKAMFKGNGLVRPLDWDLVLFAGKKQLNTVGGCFRFSIMQELHAPAVVFSDPQWVVNFRQAKRLPEYVEIALKAYLDAMNDEEKMKSWVDVMLRDAGEVNEDEDVWSLVRWVKAGRPVTTVPCMRRRLERFFWNRVVNMRKFRVPLPYTQNRYMMPDWTAFNNNGDFTPSAAVLQGNEIVIPSMEPVIGNLGACVINRQPSANWTEALVCKSVMHAAYATFGHRQCPYVFLSLANLPYRMATMGGADWDDPCQVHHDPRMVKDVSALILEGFPGKTLEELPEDAPDAPLSLLLADRRQQRMLQSNWVRLSHKLIITQVGGNGMGIGPVSNAIMVDNHNVANGIHTAPRLAEQTANLEHFIDSLKHVARVKGFSRTAFEDAVSQFWTGLTHCSAALMDRVPKRALINGRVEEVRSRVISVETDLDIALAQVNASIEQYKLLLAEESIEALSYPQELNRVRSSKEVRTLANEMVALFRERMQAGIVRESANQLAAAIADGSMERTEGDIRARGALESKLEGKAIAAAFHKAQQEVYKQFANHILALAATVEIMKRRYVNADKMNAERISDSILGGNHMVILFDKAWQLLLDFENGLDVSASGVQFMALPGATTEEGGEVPAQLGDETNPFIIVNGLSKRCKNEFDTEAVTWRQSAGGVARFYPTTWYNPESGLEDAVKVDVLTWNDWDEPELASYGWLSKKQIAAYRFQFGGQVAEAILREPVNPGFFMLADQAYAVPQAQLDAELEAIAPLSDDEKAAVQEAIIG